MPAVVFAASWAAYVLAGCWLPGRPVPLPRGMLAQCPSKFRLALNSTLFVSQSHVFFSSAGDDHS